MLNVEKLRDDPAILCRESDDARVIMKVYCVNCRFYKSSKICDLMTDHCDYPKNYVMRKYPDTWYSEGKEYRAYGMTPQQKNIYNDCPDFSDARAKYQLEVDRLMTAE